jgi:predicted glycoside hydrolase/deacetylase ChbG (UPF0249 family)
MVRWPGALHAAQVAREHPALDVGLHLDLGEWAYRDGEWVATYEVLADGDEATVEREVRAQLERFGQLLGRPPTHLDSHQHVHRHGAAATVAQRLADELAVPLRFGPEVRYCGDFYGRTGIGEPYPVGITVESLVGVLRSLPAGVTELACHPGEAGGGDPLYDEEREVELRALCDARVRAAMREAGVELTSFARLARL